jgi:hypothetical protein
MMIIWWWGREDVKKPIASTLSSSLDSYAGEVSLKVLPPYKIRSVVYNVREKGKHWHWHCGHRLHVSCPSVPSSSVKIQGVLLICRSKWVIKTVWETLRFTQIVRRKAKSEIQNPKISLRWLFLTSDTLCELTCESFGRYIWCRRTSDWYFCGERIFVCPIFICKSMRAWWIKKTTLLLPSDFLKMSFPSYDWGFMQYRKLESLKTGQVSLDS